MAGLFDVSMRNGFGQEPPPGTAQAPPVPAQAVADDAEISKVPAASSPPTFDVAPMVFIQRGTLPIVISAPHGGTVAPYVGCPERTGHELPLGKLGFVKSRDSNTRELALAIAAEIERRTGEKPYLVLASVHRKYVDFNRPDTRMAYEDEAIAPVYDLYHGTLGRFVRDVRIRHGGGLLIDVHGQGTDNNGIFRGTRNGLTVAELIKTHGIDAQNGSGSFFGRLGAAGLPTHPALSIPKASPDDAPPAPASPTDEARFQESKSYNGGEIVATTGSQNPTGIDAIQLEFGANLRAKSQRERVAGIVAATILDHLKAYPPMPRTSEFKGVPTDGVAPASP